MANGLKLLVGSVTVYAIVAACSGSRAMKSAASGGAGSAGRVSSSSGGRSGSHAGGTSSAVDSMIDPVEDAEAAEPDAGPETVTATCEADAGPFPFAIAEFPGKTRDQLASVSVLLEFSPGTIYKPPPGFVFQQTLAWVADGKVAVQCGDPAHTVAVHFLLR